MNKIAFDQLTVHTSSQKNFSLEQSTLVKLLFRLSRDEKIN